MKVRLFGTALACLLIAQFATASDVAQNEIEPVFVQLEENGKEYPMIAEKDGQKYQVYRAPSEKDGEADNFYFADKKGNKYWISEKASQNFTVSYLDAGKRKNKDGKVVGYVQTISLDKATEASRTELAKLDEKTKIGNTELATYYRHRGHRYRGHYGYRSVRYRSHRSYGGYHYGSYYRRNVYAYHSYRPYRSYSYGGYYRSYNTYSYPTYTYYSYPSYTYSSYYYGPRRTVCLYSYGYYG